MVILAIVFIHNLLSIIIIIYNIEFFHASAFNGENINKIFEYLASNIPDKNYVGDSDSYRIISDTVNENKHKGNCNC